MGGVGEEERVGERREGDGTCKIEFTPSYMHVAAVMNSMTLDYSLQVKLLQACSGRS